MMRKVVSRIAYPFNPLLSIVVSNIALSMSLFAIFALVHGHTVDNFSFKTCSRHAFDGYSSFLV